MYRSRTAVIDGPQGTTWTFGTTWSFAGHAARSLALGMAVLLAGALVAPPHTQPVAQVAADRLVASADHLVEVIVRTVVGSDSSDVEQSVLTLGGEVGHHLGIVGGFVAKVPASRLGELEHAPGVLSVTSNSHVQLLSRPLGDSVNGEAPLSHVRSVTGVSAYTDAIANGTGVGVALVDTGVANVTGIAHLSRGPDLAPGASLDGWGHGTHLAGILGGNDGAGFQGLANDANTVIVKSGADDGSTNLGTVLAALDWVLTQRSALNIRVLNLSLGIATTTDYRQDILAVAVERLWSAGIVVVVAGGNNGLLPGSQITSPGTDPYVITVGAVDTKGTESSGDDAIEPFSPRGTGARRVDVVAPGHSVVSLLSPGSVASTYSNALVGTSYIKGTGTSQAAAVVTGIVADLLELRPSLTPDQVKAVLMRSTTNVAGGDVGQGAGMVNLYRALTKSPGDSYVQTWAPATGTPAVAPAPPTAPPVAVDANGDGIPDDGVTGGGAYDFIHNGPPAPPADGTTTPGWSGGTWSGGTWSGGTWSGGTWSGGTWSGGTWSGGTWSGGTWSGGTWSGGTWSGGTWSGGTWSGGTWSGGTWSGGTWSGGTWSGGTWSGGTWSGGTWSGGTWSGGTWSGGTWSGGTWSGGTWSGGTWSGGTWSGGSWSGSVWTGTTWS